MSNVPPRHISLGNLRNSAVRGPQSASDIADRPGTRGTTGDIHGGGGGIDVDSDIVVPSASLLAVRRRGWRTPDSIANNDAPSPRRADRAESTTTPPPRRRRRHRRPSSDGEEGGGRMRNSSSSSPSPRPRRGRGRASSTASRRDRGGRSPRRSKATSSCRSTRTSRHRRLSRPPTRSARLEGK